MDVSVIVPVYNAEAYIEKCLLSLKSQSTEIDLEFIIVNDGSTDNSEIICKSIIETDERFKYYCKENGGSASARNCGIEHSKADYIAFLDSDDYVEQDYFASMFRIAECNKADVVVTSYIYELNGQKRIIKPLVKEGIYDEDEKREIMSGVISLDIRGNRTVASALWSKLFSRDLIIHEYKKINEQIRIGEDLALVVRCLNNARRICISKDATPGYHYLMRQGQITRSYDSIYERRVPLLLNSLIDANKEKSIFSFDEQFERIVVASACGGFENLLYFRDLPFNEIKTRIKYLCYMAKYYSKLRITEADTTEEKTKKYLIKSGNSFLIYIMYSILARRFGYRGENK